MSDFKYQCNVCGYGDNIKKTFDSHFSHKFHSDAAIANKYGEEPDESI